MIGYSKEEIIEKVRKIAEEMEKKVEQSKQLADSAIMDRGRLEELKNLYNMIIAVEEEEDAPAPKPKKKAKKKAKK